MGLLKIAQFIRRIGMGKKNIEFTLPEAALVLSTLVAFADDNPSEEEGVVMRKYYKSETAESVQKKLDEGGYLYPGDLKDVEQFFLPVLKEADKGFKLRTIAVAILLAQSDGYFDQDEMKLLNNYCNELQISLNEAKVYSESNLKELDDNSDYLDQINIDNKELPVLSINEAGIALSAIVSFSDDDPSDKEVGVIREHFSFDDAESLQKKMNQAGLIYPDEVSKLKPAILGVLKSVSRELQVKLLAISYKVSEIDGIIDEDEIKIIKNYCEDLFIGLSEVKEFFKTSLV